VVNVLGVTWESMAAAQAFVLTAQQVGIKMPREVHNVNHAQSTRFLKEQVPPR
jgi:hypothetical protein|tara:strand:+ start:201 stop:359 length:159 start_codon:yes stop_codon:yes gene_type:complete